ncbi:MAG: DUF1080 domain-containing protein [Planctomycetia bacterium]|nr:DUF1080 domain-containing protein [Planctomycetia bacterium]
MLRTRMFMLCLTTVMATTVFAVEWKSGILWERPPVVEGKMPVLTPPPAGAVVLFDGKDMSQFDNGEKWIVKDGVVTADKTSVSTKQPFGSCRMHIEFATPAEVVSQGQGRGNSGVIFMGEYELQILDSYQNDTYFDGQCGSIYKQNPPMRNVCRKPGEWQSYDITFVAPKFDDKGNLVRPARMTAYQNGELIQNNFEIKGHTFWHMAPTYTAHPAKKPLLLQYHGNPIQFRNIWLEEIED